jgi:hypothetical protein
MYLYVPTCTYMYLCLCLYLRLYACTLVRLYLLHTSHSSHTTYMYLLHSTYALTRLRDHTHVSRNARSHKGVFSFAEEMCQRVSTTTFPKILCSTRSLRKGSIVLASLRLSHNPNGSLNSNGTSIPSAFLSLTSWFPALMELTTLSNSQ